MNKVIVIGASGFLGSHVLKALRHLDCEVYAVVHNTPVDKEGIHIIPGGIRALNTKLIEQIGPEYIFHCARPTFTRFRRSGRRIAAMLAERNNKYLLRILKQTSKQPLLLFASGSLMYGDSDHPHDEDARLNPISYAKQYFRGERPLLKSTKDQSYPLCLIRLPWLLGPGSWFKWFYMNNIQKYSCIPSFGNTSNYMEILDVRDAAELIISVAETNQPGIYNIPGGERLRQSEFLAKLSDVFRTPSIPYHELSTDIENEALEAFTSNILLKSKHSLLIASYRFKSVNASLSDIKAGKWG